MRAGHRNEKSDPDSSLDTRQGASVLKILWDVTFWASYCVIESAKNLKEECTDIDKWTSTRNCDDEERFPYAYTGPIALMRYAHLPSLRVARRQLILHIWK
jgi:hypothetical protein